MNQFEIYYFTGTGNARQIAEWIAELVSENNIKSNIHNIAKQPPAPATKSTIIVISPVHGFNYPPIVLNFIKHFPKGSNDLILICTRAGLKISKHVTPGATGISFALASFILRRKGYQITGAIPFDMPSNWLLLHPALRQKSSDYLLKVNREKLQNYFKQILSGKRIYKSPVLLSCLLAPVAFMYYFCGRFILAKTLYADNECTQCKICLGSCPLNAISFKDGHPYWHTNCESCMRCINSCPHNAIQVASLSILVTIIICILLIHPLNSIWTKLAVTLILPLPLQAAIYRLQHRLLKIKAIASLVKYSSLTFYKFWGRYKDLLKKFKEK